MEDMLLALLLMPSTAFADDLGDALHFIEETAGTEEIAGWEALSEPDSNAALPMLVSRDVKPGAPLDSYDCAGSSVDQPVLRTSGEEKLLLRACMEARWEKDSLAGYRTLGEVRLDPKTLDDTIRAASRETNVPAQLIDIIIRYSSGYRPGVISDDGRYGLMQLEPHHLRSLGIEMGDLLDPRTNIFAGARYLARLTHRYGDLLLALAALRSSPETVEAAGRQLPKERDVIWFVRETVTVYFNAKLDVPETVAVESMAFVFNWLD
jgi:soluble lytic murein transglycosylase-like protein